MNKWKKAISAGMSAALLASLFTLSAAPAVFGANTSSGGGTVVPGGSASAAGSITFAEDAVAQFSDGGSFGFTLAVYDSDGTDADATFSTTTAPTVTRNLGVGSCSAGFVADTLVVSCSGMDDTKFDSFTISGLKISAAVTAEAGAVILTTTANGLNISEILATASGLTTGAITGGVSTTVAYSVDSGSPLFGVTGATCIGGATVGSVTVAASGVVAAETFSTSTAAGTFTKATPFTGDKPIGTAVTQSACAARFPSFVTVGDAIEAYLDGGTETWSAGVSRQDADDVCATLGYFDDLLASGATVVFTIATAGVTFSTNFNTIEDWSASGVTVTGDPTLSADLKSLTFTTSVASDAGDEICIDPDYDIAAGVPTGTPVDVNVSSGTVLVLGNPVTVAYVGYVVVGVASVPNVIIAQTNQSAGVITLTESAAGSITDSEWIEICLDSPTAGASWSNGTYFWAVVTVGDLKLNVGGLPVSQGKLALDGFDCIEILNYTASTVASTIEIHTGSATAPAAGGPRINVWNSADPGPIFVNVYSDGDTVARNVIIAMAVYSGSPIAAALSQPVIVPGGLSQAGGDITITEGRPGAFEDGEEISLCIMDSAFNQNSQVTWSSPVGVNAPFVSTNSTASGLIAHFDQFGSDPWCLEIDIDSDTVTTLGVITVSNLKFNVVSDAVLGPVFIRVESSEDSFIDQFVSNAVVARPVTLSEGSALGVVTISGTYTAATKIAALNKYVTFRIGGGANLAGKTVEIWIATKAANGTWSAFTKVTARNADASGNAYYHVRNASAKWISVRGYYQGSWSPARQARWL